MMMLPFKKCLLFCSLLWIIPSWKQSKTLTLTIEVNGLSNSKGNVHVGLYRKQDDFPDIKGTFKNKIQLASEKKLVFENLPQGNYAVAVFHDLNKNGKMDTNLFGVPTEKYGFSNNARSTFSAPDFEDAAFNLSENRKISITIK